jgi:hypothetical protein
LLVCRASLVADAGASSLKPGPMAAIRQERSSASGLTGDVDGGLPFAQNTAF